MEDRNIPRHLGTDLDSRAPAGVGRAITADPVSLLQYVMEAAGAPGLEGRNSQSHPETKMDSA